MKSEDKAIILVEVLEDTSKGKIRIHRQNMYAGPMRDQETVDFWEARLDRLKVPYLLAVVEMAERDVDTGETAYTRGQTIFVDPKKAP